MRIVYDQWIAALAHQHVTEISPKAGDPRLAERFMAWLLSPDGARVLRGASLDALDRPILVGSGVPGAVSAATARTDTSAAP